MGNFLLLLISSFGFVFSWAEVGHSTRKKKQLFVPSGKTRTEGKGMKRRVSEVCKVGQIISLENNQLHPSARSHL